MNEKSVNESGAELYPCELRVCSIWEIVQFLSKLYTYYKSRYKITNVHTLNVFFAYFVNIIIKKLKVHLFVCVTQFKQCRPQ